MALRKIKFVEGETYHVYNRGNFKHEIFHDNQDYERFQKILFLSNGTKRFKYKEFLKSETDAYLFERGEKLVDIMCFVMMPNHLHLMLENKLLTPGKSGGINKNIDNNLSIFMKRVSAAYSMYYNRKYNKTGGLFEGKFKAEHVSNDNYFKYLFAYIHLNPIKLIQKDWKEVGIQDFNKAKKFLQEYKYSSFKDYFIDINKDEGDSLIINRKSFLSKINPDTDLNGEIFGWLKFKTIV